MNVLFENKTSFFWFIIIKTFEYNDCYKNLYFFLNFKYIASRLLHLSIHFKTNNL